MILQVCVHVFYGNEGLFRRLEESRFRVSFVAVREVEWMPKGCVVREDIGVDMGSWNWFLGNAWDGESGVVFMQDDTRIEDVEVLGRFERVQFDHASIFRSVRQELLSGGHHGRVFYCSGRLLRELGEFPCDWDLRGLADGGLSKPLGNEPSREFWAWLGERRGKFDVLNRVVVREIDVGRDNDWSRHRHEDSRFWSWWFVKWRKVKCELGRFVSRKG